MASGKEVESFYSFINIASLFLFPNSTVPIETSYEEILSIQEAEEQEEDASTIVEHQCRWERLEPGGHNH